MKLEDRIRWDLAPLVKRHPPAGLVDDVIRIIPTRSQRIPRSFAAMRRLFAAAALLAVVALVVVTLPAKPSPRDPTAIGTSPEPSLTAAPGVTNVTPQPSAPAETPVAATTTVAPLDSPSQLSEKERSDQFWGGVSFFIPYSLTYSSLGEITDAAHVVVIGRLVGFSDGVVEPFGGDLPPEMAKTRQETFGVIAVNEVLKGEPIMRSPATIEDAGLGGSGMSAAELPKGRFIIFLMNYAQLREESGVAPSNDPDDRFHYARPNAYQCVLRDMGNVIDIVDGPKGWEANVGPFPSGLDGQPFEDVAQRVRDAAAAKP